jgi:hypothetical protein
MRKHLKRRGIAMVVVMMSLTILAITTLGIVYVGNFSLMQSRSQGESDEALFAAHAGLNIKIAQLRSGDVTDIVGTVSNSNATYNTDVFTSGQNPWTGFTVPGSDTFYILSEGTSDDGRVRRLGMLLQETHTTFNAAILAGNAVHIESASYTDTFDSSDPTATLDHTLANIGLWSPSATVTISPASRVGKDGGVGTADIVVPTGGGAGQVVSGSAGSHYDTLTVDPLLAAPPTITARPYAGPTISLSGGTQTVSPTLIGSEWVFRSDELKVETGANLIFDISMVPNGEVAHFDVGKVIMETFGTITVDDGGVTDAVVELYAENEFKLQGGAIVNPSSVPDRFKLFCRNNDMKLESASATYVVAQSNTAVFVENASQVFGSVAAPIVKLQGGSAVHYDQALATGGGTGGSTLTLLSFHTHSKASSRP